MSAGRAVVPMASVVIASALSLVAPVTVSASAGAAAFVVSRSQFDRLFPGRNSFYGYRELTDALGAYPGFARTGGQTTRRREAAAFLANVSHETGGLRHIVEQNRGAYGHYCDKRQPYGCPAGDRAYYGRGPLQLSWNFNYKAAGDALHIDLLHDPYRVEKDATVAWKTALWFWNAQRGAGTMTPHEAMVRDKGFGETIRSINGDLECNGKNPGERQNRIDLYKRFAGVLGVGAGGNLSC